MSPTGRKPFQSPFNAESSIFDFKRDDATVKSALKADQSMINYLCKVIWRLAFISPVVSALFFSVAAQTYIPPANNRADIILDSGWRFIRQDVPGAQTNNFDDSAWSVVNLPHTWNNLDGENGPGDGYYRGIGWYRSHYTVDGSYAGRQFFLKFDGAFSVADVWINGNYLGEHQGGFAAFVFDATSYVNVGGDNVIAVKVNNAFNANIPPLNADFTFFGGMYRDVHLLVTDPVQISPLDYGSPGVYLKPANVSSNSANLQITTVVSNSTAIDQTVTVRAIVTDAATNIVTTLTNVVTISAESASNIVASTTIANPHLWNGLSDPYQYQTFIEIYNGTNVTDIVSQPLGFRWFSIDPTNGFFLNGQHYDLHGVDMHQDWLDCGWALNDAQRQTNFMVLKEIGATAARLSHYEHSDFTYQLADQNGIILWSEIPLIDYITESPAFYTNAEQQLREMIRQRYNHPSVVCWSIFNEITQNSGPSPTNLVSQLAQIEAQEDPTRPSTAAADSGDGDPTTIYSQLIAFNKYYGWYSSPSNGFAAWADNIHKNYPTRCIGVSEYGAGASIYQHMDNTTPPANTATPFHPEEWQNTVHEINWQQMSSRPFLWCKFVWNLFDFASDTRNEGDTPGRNDKGLVTYDRQVRKDAFYWYKANWTTNPFVYITSRRFAPRGLPNSAIGVKVYANCDSVQLLFNGISEGALTSTNHIYNWAGLTLTSGSNTVVAIGTAGSQSYTDSVVWVTANAVNAGGPTVGQFTGDTAFVGGTASSTSTMIDTNGVFNPAPEGVYQTERYGNSTYTFSGLTATNYIVRLHFAEFYWSSAGQRKFNVSINGTQVLTNFDIIATAGAPDKATVQQFTAAPNGSGQIVIQFTTVVDNAKISGIEVLSNQTPLNQPPVITINSPTGNITVLGKTNSSLLLNATVTDDGLPQPPSLTTLWTQVSGPGTVVFGTPGASNTTAQFSLSGVYVVRITASDGQLQTTHDVTVVVDPNNAFSSGLMAYWKFDETGGTTAFDSSSNGITATVNGATFTSGYISNALHFNGTSADATFASPDANQITLTAWVRADAQGNSVFPRILDTPGYRLFFRFDASGSNVLDFATYSTVNGDWFTGQKTVGIGSWYNVVASYDRTSFANLPALYVNGVKLPVTTHASPSGAQPAYTGTGYIGNVAALNRAWNGSIDELRIYNRILSDTEVKALASMPPANLAPVVSAGSNQNIIWPAAASLNGSVTDDGKPNPPGAVTTTWSELSGPGTVTFGNSNSPATTASFSMTGSYVLQLVADDGQAKTSGNVTVNAVVQPIISLQSSPAVLQLSWPANDGNWLLQYQTNPVATGLGTNWMFMPGTMTNPFVVPIDPAAGSVFYRLFLTN
jgi:beta-galactosidase